MNTRISRAGASLLALAAIAGCETSPHYGAQVPDNFGEATKQTLAAQVIDPHPEYLSAVPVSSGKHAADAIDRYNNDAVKQPETQSVSEVVTSGSAR